MLVSCKNEKNGGFCHCLCKCQRSDKKMKKDFELHFFSLMSMLVWNIADIGNYFLSQLPLQILCWTYLQKLMNNLGAGNNRWSLV